MRPVIRNIPCVVTNLRVLAENEEFTVHNLTGDGIIPVQGMIAAVGSDIALLRVAQIAPPAKPLPVADDVVRQAKATDIVILIGNRKSGGVGVKSGTISKIVGGRVEVLTEFEPGNNGGPVFDSAAGAVVGVTTYSEAHGIARTSAISLGDVTPNIQEADTRWYVSRLDTVSKWETVNPVLWRRQNKQIDEFRKDSLALVAMLRGDMGTARSQPAIAKFLDHFLLNMTPHSLNNVIITDKMITGASVLAVQRLLHDALEYAETSNMDLEHGTF